MLCSSTRSPFQWPELRAYHRHAIRLHTQWHTLGVLSGFICSLSPVAKFQKLEQPVAPTHTHARSVALNFAGECNFQQRHHRRRRHRGKWRNNNNKNNNNKNGNNGAIPQPQRI